jgi:hypothetical protein
LALICMILGGKMPAVQDLILILSKNAINV